MKSERSMTIMDDHMIAIGRSARLGGYGTEHEFGG
jgi:hypothetical protein